MAAILLLGSRFLLILFFPYMCICLLHLLLIYSPLACPYSSMQCLRNYATKTPYPPLKLWVYSSTSQSPNGGDLYPVWELDDFKANESFTKDVTVRIPFGLHNNGTMFVHVFLTPVEEGGRGEDDPFEADWVVNQTGKHTYIGHQTTPLQVTSDDPTEKQELKMAGDHLTRNWRSRLPLNVMTTDVIFSAVEIPRALDNHVRPLGNQFLPILVIDEMNYRTKDLLPLNKSCKEMPLTISYTPVSYLTFCMRVIMTISHEVNGTIETEVDDDLKEAFTDRFPATILTDSLLLFFMLFQLTTIESDLNFWDERKTMAGLSSQAVVWRCVCTLVILLYMLDQNRSLYNLITFSIASIVEIWKVMKMFKARISVSEWRLLFENAAVSDKERETQELDSQAMRCLSYALYPLWVAVIIYNLMYNFHLGWYSLCIKSLVTGFSCFGWLFMLPQVFINYKLKSVADLPWEVLTFRAFGEYIMDIRLILMKIPLSSIGVYFLDDVIFVVYLYQRWLYRKTNEKSE